MKGIILAGGLGTRLFPLTKVVSKQLLPVYDKPMIYYPLATLMMAQIREILVISAPADLPSYKTLLGDGSQMGIKLLYASQKKPDGVAQAFVIAKDFIGDETCALILGDNIFHGERLSEHLKTAVKHVIRGYATIFGYAVSDPERFGVVELDENNHIVSLEEKPRHPKSNYCITGLYFYDNKVLHHMNAIHPSPRGELEITDINKQYLAENTLKIEILEQGCTWFDVGTVDSLLEATHFISTLQRKQGNYLSMPEEVAYRNGWILKSDLRYMADLYHNSFYGEYLRNI